MAPLNAVRETAGSGHGVAFWNKPLFKPLNPSIVYKILGSVELTAHLPFINYLTIVILDDKEKNPVNFFSSSFFALTINGSVISTTKS